MRMSDPTKTRRQAEDYSLELECVHMLLIADAQRGLADIAAGRTVEAETAITQRQQQRAGTPDQTMR